jgi:hypothetical protein
MSIQIPDGYERTEWLNATHALSNGVLLKAKAFGGCVGVGSGSLLFVKATMDELGLIPLRKLPEIDLSPLKPNEFALLQLGDTFIAPVDALKTVEAIGVGVIYDTQGNRWIWRESGAMTPTPETAHRLRGEAKQ